MNSEAIETIREKYGYPTDAIKIISRDNSKETKLLFGYVYRLESMALDTLTVEPCEDGIDTADREKLLRDAADRNCDICPSGKICDRRADGCKYKAAILGKEE